jgi:hypothetical protein
MRVSVYSETLIQTYQTAWRYSPEESNIYRDNEFSDSEMAGDFCTG